MKRVYYVVEFIYLKRRRRRIRKVRIVKRQSGGRNLFRVKEFANWMRIDEFKMVTDCIRPI